MTWLIWLSGFLSGGGVVAAVLMGRHRAQLRELIKQCDAAIKLR